ncbi:MAG: SDR family oxidoreductase [Polyangiaceae bacterium]
MRWVITGANRGIGLEFVRQLAARGDAVDALARTITGPLAELADGERVRAVPCDVTSESSIAAALTTLGSAPVDVVVNNAGVMGKLQAFTELDLADVTQTFEVNALGPIRVTRAFLPSLLRGKTRRVVSITSGMGSIGDNTRGGAYGYRMSKAALNMAMKSLSIDYADQGIVAVVMNPGWVQTDMGGEGAPTPVETSVAMMLARIDGLTPSENGTFLDYRGGSLTW